MGWRGASDKVKRHYKKSRDGEDDVILVMPYNDQENDAKGLVVPYRSLILLDHTKAHVRADSLIKLQTLYSNGLLKVPVERALELLAQESKFFMPVSAPPSGNISKKKKKKSDTPTQEPTDSPAPTTPAPHFDVESLPTDWAFINLVIGECAEPGVPESRIAVADVLRTNLRVAVCMKESRPKPRHFERAIILTSMYH